MSDNKGVAQAKKAGASWPLTIHFSRPYNREDKVMLLLHPFPYSASAWEPVLPYLRDYVVVCPDMPGCGFSPDWDNPSFDEVARQLVPLLRSYGIERAVVAGESMGGYLALAITEYFPEFVAGLALVDTKAGEEPADAKAGREEIAQAAIKEGAKVVADSWQGVLGTTTKETRADVVRTARVQLAGMKPSGIAWCQRAIANRPNRLGVLGAYEGPTLLVRGEEDALSSAEIYEEMEKVAADAQYVTLEQVGHLPNFEAPQLLAQALVDLVGRTSFKPQD